MLNDIKACCMFIGNSRSGTTLLGSLLNAHPNIAIAIKLDFFQYLHKHLITNQKELFSRLLQKSVSFVEQKCLDRGYNYTVPNSYQGKNTELNIIGDNASGTSCIYLTKYPYLLDEFQKMLDVPIKFLYTIRNPYDVIASTFNDTRRKKRLNFTIHTAIEDTLTQYRTMQWLEKKVGASLYKIRHDIFIQNPKIELTKICNFLEVEATEDYLKCTEIVNSTPHFSRHEVYWPLYAKSYIQNKIKDFSFLKGYTFDT